MKFSVKNTVKYLAVGIFVLGTGSLYFQVLRMPLLAIMMVAISLPLLRSKRYFSKKNLMFAIGLTGFYLINTIVNFKNGFYLNDLIIWIVKVYYVIILAGYFTFEEFCKKYTKVMICEALISLVCFLIADIMGYTNILPLYTTGANAANSYYLTPYYTIGWGNIPVFHRNAGIYWEPGGHQIFLNLALYFLLSDPKFQGQKKHTLYLSVAVLVLAILTTQSTTGYFCFPLVLMSVMFKSERYRGKWKMQLVMLLFLGIQFAVELYTGIISLKLEGTAIGASSGATRLNDTIVGYTYALSNPIFGVGSFATTASNYLRIHGVVNISNGMASFVINNGIVATIVLLIKTFKGIRDKLPYGIVNNILFFIFVLICVNTESVFMNLFMMIFLFQWKTEQSVCSGG